VSAAELLAMQAAVLRIRVAPSVREYIGRIALASRDHPAIGLPVSVRATVALQRAAQARAALLGRDHVLPDDVKRLAPAVLAHRLAVTGMVAEEAVGELIERVAIPGVP
jgi:MoxR-like ATPase